MWFFSINVYFIFQVSFSFYVLPYWGPAGHWWVSWNVPIFYTLFFFKVYVKPFSPWVSERVKLDWIDPCSSTRSRQDASSHINERETREIEQLMKCLFSMVRQKEEKREGASESFSSNPFSSFFFLGDSIETDHEIRLPSWLFILSLQLKGSPTPRLFFSIVVFLSAQSGMSGSWKYIVLVRARTHLCAWLIGEGKWNIYE